MVVLMQRPLLGSLMRPLMPEVNQRMCENPKRGVRPEVFEHPGSLRRRSERHTTDSTGHRAAGACIVVELDA